MTRFYINRYECGHSTLHNEGVVVADVAAACEIAVAKSRAIMGAEVYEGRLRLSCKIEVLGDDGKIAVNVPLVDAPAVSGI